MANNWVDEAEQLLQQLAEPQYNAVRLFIKVDAEKQWEEDLSSGREQVYREIYGGIAIELRPDADG